MKKSNGLGKKLFFEATLPLTADEIYAWHTRRALERLLLSWRHVSIPPSPKENEAKVVVRFHWGPFSLQWILAYEKAIAEREFVAIQCKGPFHSYTHKHHFHSVAAASCKLVDEIYFETKFPFLGQIAEKYLSRFFFKRCTAAREDLKLFSKHPKESKKILLSGSSGFMGSRLKNFLEIAGHQVVRLVRSREQLGADAIFWNPEKGEGKKEDFEGFDAVIHLAGAGLVEKRWTEKRKKTLFLSRCRDTWLLSQILCRLYQPPKTVISASAIGFYGDRGEEILTEESEKGKGFLSDICLEWEKATKAIENRGSRVVHPRCGVVVEMNGGALGKMIPFFQWGLGSVFGSGKQMISWIAMDDLLGSFYHCLMDEEISGVVNFVSPHPIAQASFVKLLAASLKRPAFLRFPKFFLKLVFGAMAQECLLSSQKVEPKRLIDSGYAFRYPELKNYFSQLK